MSLDARRVVEALRAGVPSAAAVRALGTGQDDLESRFRALLASADGAGNHEHQVDGLLVQGGFGTGKSHLLTAFEHIALDEGFCASRVVISKETPLYDPAKLLQSAAEAMRSPGEVDRGLGGVFGRCDRPELEALERRLRDEDLNSRFAATLSVYAHGFHDQELADRVVRFWSGDKLNVSDIRRAVRDVEGRCDYPLEKIAARDLALQTLTVISHLTRAAGLRGWVLLIDEVELIGRYSRLQRARAYAELARWLGRLPGERRPGLVSVGAISGDFESEVLVHKGDRDALAPYMEARGESDVAERATIGMDLIRVAPSLTSPPDRDLLRSAYNTLRALHGEAYAWQPPDVRWPDQAITNRMRQYVRAWINAWDLRRLDPTFVEGENPYAMLDPVSDYREDANPADEDLAGERDEGPAGA